MDGGGALVAGYAGIRHHRMRRGKAESLDQQVPDRHETARMEQDAISCRLADIGMAPTGGGDLLWRRRFAFETSSQFSFET